MLAPSLAGDNEFAAALGGRKPLKEDARVDMTAMIDLVFMLNIFFLVTSLVTALAEVDLPAAKHVVGADLEESVVLTLVAVADGGAAQVFLGDGNEAESVSQADAEVRIAAYVDEAKAAGKKNVVIKAEKRVPLREIARVAAAASSEDMMLNLAVMEKDD